MQVESFSAVVCSRMTSDHFTLRPQEQTGQKRVPEQQKQLGKTAFSVTGNSYSLEQYSTLTGDV